MEGWLTEACRTQMQPCLLPFFGRPRQDACAQLLLSHGCSIRSAPQGNRTPLILVRQSVRLPIRLSREPIVSMPWGAALTRMSLPLPAVIALSVCLPLLAIVILVTCIVIWYRDRRKDEELEEGSCKPSPLVARHGPNYGMIRIRVL